MASRTKTHKTNHVSLKQQELAGLKAQAVEIGEEEAKVDGHTSGALVALVRKILAISFPSWERAPTCARAPLPRYLFDELAMILCMHTHSAQLRPNSNHNTTGKPIQRTN